ncbi:ketosteroid isomerase-like protein [Longimicrobium terrae]|uniref:Ketosteroid isomerase-like protein n=2 Tax=Longimicrobium terrae TaxID=1639882 RepID=A0A841H3M8_9BACT|nr:ketosteroid isomerase-like protein [Longimicrobium terrae]MBB6072610.1 ketosteroid isomerase-like protein [Longimicrobium terrae]NNC28611.1 nuclear transport factor 2 family protein [Longimicrobium terrae]
MSMHTTPVDAVHAWIEAVNDADADRLVALSDARVEIIGPRGSVRGAEVLRDWLTRAGLTMQASRTFARGTAVVVHGRGVWRAPDGAVLGEQDVASRFVVEEGKIAAYERFDDLAAALARAGLAEEDEVSAG